MLKLVALRPVESSTLSFPKFTLPLDEEKLEDFLRLLRGLDEGSLEQSQIWLHWGHLYPLSLGLSLSLLSTTILYWEGHCRLPGF